ncbi:MAG: tetratricopeptide repeat protein [Eubacteriales bacterium]|nr:tetratricopeptide repeat protein [Eubacteriales bacterium]
MRFPEKRVRIAVLLAAALSLTSGCALRGSGENLSAGMSAVQNREYDSALASFDAALEAGEDEKSAQRGRGIALMGQGDYEGAAQAFEAALACGSGIPEDIDYDINYYLAACFMKLGQTGEARAVYDAMIALRPNDAQTYELRGAAELEQGAFDAADADFRRAIEIEPTNYDRMIEILETLQSHGYEETGQTYLSEALETYGEGMSNFDKGRLSYYLEDYDTARTCLEKARSDTNYQATVLLGKTYEALGDYNYALSVYQAYLANDTTHPEIYNQMGLCQMAMGSYQEALLSFEEGMKIQDNAVLQSLSFNEIIAYEYLGEFKKASVLMETYLENYPEDETAKREAVFLETR